MLFFSNKIKQDKINRHIKKGQSKQKEKSPRKGKETDIKKETHHSHTQESLKCKIRSHNTYSKHLYSKKIKAKIRKVKIKNRKILTWDWERSNSQKMLFNC